MEHNNDAAAAAATVADDVRPALLAGLLAEVAGCFPRRETRQACTEMTGGLLMELEDKNCWTLAEAIGHRRPCRLHHFLSRAVWDQELMLDIAAAWAAARLGDGDGVLIIDETGDAKSSTDAAGAARQYSGSTGGVALCQVMVTLTYATSRGHTLLGRALYLPGSRASDEEHRELTGIPDEIMFATKPELAGDLAEHACELGIEAAMVTGDEVYGGRDLRQRIRGLGLGYVLAVRSNHLLTLGSGKTMTAAGAAAAATAARHRHPTAPSRPGAHPGLVRLAAPPPASRPASPPALERLRRHRRPMTTNYSCRICADNRARNLATLRNLEMGLIRQHGRTGIAATSATPNTTTTCSTPCYASNKPSEQQ